MEVLDNYLQRQSVDLSERLELSIAKVLEKKGFAFASREEFLIFCKENITMENIFPVGYIFYLNGEKIAQLTSKIESIFTHNSFNITCYFSID